MAIYDCFQFFNEEHILDLRLNILNKFVDFFVIVESTNDHQGNIKKLNLDLNKFKKFENKIIYIVVDDTEEIVGAILSVEVVKVTFDTATTFPIVSSTVAPMAT